MDDQSADFKLESSSLHEAWLPMGNGRKHPSYYPEINEYQVEFDGIDDQWHPQNWKSGTKHCIAIIACLGSFVAAFDSAMYAASTAQVSSAFDVSEEVATLGTSLFVLGFASGPLIFAPSSEVMGRRWPLIIGMLGSSIFAIGSASACNIQTLIICRFFSGVCGSSPLCVVPGILADLYNNTHRGVAISIYALTVYYGPFLAPIIGSYAVSSYLGWRWSLYLPAIMGFVNTIFILIFVRETYPCLILVSKAAKLREQTGNWAIHAEYERISIDINAMVQKYFTRPLRMLTTEPIVLLVSLYMSFIYSLMYALVGAYPWTFQHTYHMATAVSTLPLLGLFIGVTLAVAFVLFEQRDYTQRLTQNNGQSMPEWRLGPSLVGAVAFPIGLFWFAWTAWTSSIHFMVPAVAGVMIGFGMVCVFLPCFNYLVDAYLPMAASVVAANVMLRSCMAAAFPLFSKQMFQNLGVQWAGTLLGCLAIVMIPIPILFRRYGARLRLISKLLTPKPSSR